MNELSADPAVVAVASGKGRADENFPVGSRLISARLRPHVHAYYAFARAIDDIADNSRIAPEDKLARLGAMRAAVLGQTPAPGVAHADEIACAERLRRSLTETGVSAEVATDLIVAFERDATQARTGSWDDLLDYCRYSANPVGRYLLALHGEGPAPLAASDALCTALQILNHLQDCAEDLALLDRCYIPLDWLAAEGLDVEALHEHAASVGLRRVMDRMLDGVDQLHRQARRLPRSVRDRRMRLEAAVIVQLSHRLAARLRWGDPLAARVKLTRFDVGRSLLRGLATGLLR